MTWPTCHHAWPTLLEACGTLDRRFGKRARPKLKKGFPEKALPKVVFTDRGLGFFHPNGAITAEWQAGLEEAATSARGTRGPVCPKNT